MASTTAVPEVALRSGDARPMPAIGMGTAKFPVVPETTVKAVLEAVEVGYRHFDTAAMYATERPLGEALAEAVRRGLLASREEVFVTSKLWCTQCHPHLVLPSLRESLQNLQMEYVDLYLIHWPISLKPGPAVFPVKREDAVPFDFEGVWRAMEECHRLGLAKAIGVSNFTTSHLDKLLPAATVPPAVNQVAEQNTSGDEPGLAAEEAEGVLRREGHPRRGLLAVGRAELERRRERRAGLRGARGDRQGQREDRRTGSAEVDLRARGDPDRQELQQGEAQGEPRDLRLGARRRRPAQDRPDSAEEDRQS
ncbi:hypothetical protein ACQJBY_016335 [Aegilops geniculata]